MTDETFIHETLRLGFRRWRPEDVDALLVTCQDPEIMRFHRWGRPLERHEVEVIVESLEAHWDRFGYGLWAAVLRETNTVVGWNGVADTHHVLATTPAELHARVLPSVEVGYRLNRSLWGQGLELEGVLFCLDHAFSTLGMERVLSIFHVDNNRWRKLADVLGMSFVARATQKNDPPTDVPIEIRELTSEEWAERGFRAASR